MGDNIEGEIWTPVIVKHHGPEFEKEVYERYEVSNFCRIRNRKTGKISQSKGEGFRFFDNKGEQKGLLKHRVCLASFKPEELPGDINKYECDHINGDHSDMRLENLQWITKSEHNTKTFKQTIGKRKSQKEKLGKQVIITHWKHDVEIGPSMVGRTFDSIVDAGSMLNVNTGSISGSHKRGGWATDYKFSVIRDPLLEGEIFKRFGEYEVSNKGRIKNTRGKIHDGADPSSGKSRVVSIKINGENKKYLMHRLVWMAFNGEIPLEKK